MEKPVTQAAITVLKLKSQMDDPLRACVHCGLCLEDCPTYRLTGDEGNSPRGRLLLWRSMEEGRVEPDEWTDFYTDECVGCLACETACPANVPYGHLLEKARHEQVAAGRAKIDWKIRAAGVAVKKPALFNLALSPARALRALGALPHSLVFPGKPAVTESTASYARRLVEEKQPTGPSAALLTGCLMEALFREINFATVRVLVENNVRVVIPEDQGCCGAFHEHTGMSGLEEMIERNRRSFRDKKIDRVLSNSAGCGLALGKALEGDPPVQDVLGFLGEVGVKSRRKRPEHEKVFIDLPCHLIHGQKVAGIPKNVLDATGYIWQLAPCARDCCGSGGVYNIQKPQNARDILRGKSAFFNELPSECAPILATANHVCMMQWNTARAFVKRPFQVRHVIQLLDPLNETHANTPSS
ncbi:MAG: (Fe-S)-binding protein [Opitutales bacterium]